MPIAGSTTPRPRRLRNRSGPPSPTGISPVVWVVIVSLMVFGAWRAWDAYEQGRTYLTAIGPDGAPAPALELTFFPERFAFTAPSPPPPLGSQQLAAGATLSVGGELVPERAVVRYSGPGVGTGFTFVQNGQRTNITVEPPTTIWGQVVESLPYWWFGWRRDFVSVVGAKVIVMGGGEHGIPLAEATTGIDGAFEIRGIAAQRGPIALRVLSAPHAIVHAPLDLAAMAEAGQVVRLQRAPPRRGRLLCPEGQAREELLILARGLPGVEAHPDADGSFVLNHVPEELEPRLLVIGLPEHLVAKPTVARVGVTPTVEVVTAAVVHGVVVDARLSPPQPLGGTLVWSGESVAIRADADGRFELRQIVPGTIDITAQHTYQPKNRKAIVRHGSATATVEPGQELRDVVIEVQ